MARLSDTGLTQHDTGSGGGQFKWVKDRDLVGYELKFVEIGTRHVEEFYLPSGDLMKEHDELIIMFEFADDQDEQTTMLGDYEGPHGRYKFSTNAVRIKRVLEHIEGKYMPLEGVVICVDQQSKYQSLYLGEATSGDGLPETPTTGQSHTPAQAALQNQQNRNSQQPAASGSKPVDRRTTTSRT